VNSELGVDTLEPEYHISGRGDGMRRRDGIFELESWSWRERLRWRMEKWGWFVFLSTRISVE
jgi:hypothetical protein